MPMSSKEMIKLLEKNGFIYVKSGDGSHRKFKNPKTGKVTQVPYHSKELSKGLERAILKQAGII
ncbi:MAG: type II toxin-antitoxin system HicA family toxin [Peptoniphilaceae bacterium]|nr:type II toxin-antitoxin system HicA family toxin [Peptoniphilaceae bacterium]MDD7383803.1 type II toxin-antitoxin system HicA family toxin [Peptoniphilaceae bacterium]MDY3737799.1 type II toxin-antitoxin system HicA family toxin [Peptoniphilaceae bacterium]